MKDFGFKILSKRRCSPVMFPPAPFSMEAVTEVNDLRVQKSLHLGVDHIKMYSHPTNELSKGSGG